MYLYTLHWGRNTYLRASHPSRAPEVIFWWAFASAKEARVFIIIIAKHTAPFTVFTCHSLLANRQCCVQMVACFSTPRPTYCVIRSRHSSLCVVDYLPNLVSVVLVLFCLT